MHYADLRDFITQLEKKGLLQSINYPVSPYLEMTVVCDRVLKKNGPALLFTAPKDAKMPVLGNLFGTQERIALALGANSPKDLREIGQLLANLKQQEPPKKFTDIVDKGLLLIKALNLTPKLAKKPLVHENVYEKDEVDLANIPIQTCWPGDISPLITWGLVTTKSPAKPRENLGIYRLQVKAKNQVIMRWLKHRGGALDYQAFVNKYKNERFPIAVSIGADPATTLAAVMPIPDNVSEYAFAGFLRNSKTELAKCIGSDLHVPARSEIVLEGYIEPNHQAEEGPFGDHTGYYNEVETFPVMTVERVCMRNNPIYHTTYTGRPPDEPAVLGLALNEIFIPFLQQQYPEIVDFYLPAEACSYRMAIVTIRKQFPGHARQIMMGVWSFLRQFMYTKFVVVCDDDINARNLNDVIWALSTRVDPVRDVMMVENTPIDYLDFASPKSSLGSKMGVDATNKWPGETKRKWGNVIKMDKDVLDLVNNYWDKLGL